MLGAAANAKLRLTNMNAELAAKVAFNKIVGVEVVPK